MYRYLRLSSQPLHIRFNFKPTHFHRSSIGTVQITISASEREYGPYDTNIHTTTGVWDRRKSLRPSQASWEVNQHIQVLNKQLEKAWESLLSINQSITGDMILEKAGLTYPVGEKLDLLKLSYLGKRRPKGFANSVSTQKG